MVKSTGCSSRGPRFNSQHSHGSSQLFVTPVPGDLTSSHRHTCKPNTNAHKIKINLIKQKQTKCLVRSQKWAGDGGPRPIILALGRQRQGGSLWVRGQPGLRGWWPHTVSYSALGRQEKLGFHPSSLLLWCSLVCIVLIFALFWSMILTFVFWDRISLSSPGWSGTH